MKKFFRVLTQSFYSKELYQDAAYKWDGAGFSLLALLSFFSMLLFVVITLLATTGSGYSDAKKEIIAQFPQITIAEGRMSADVPMPYYFSVDGQKFALLDTRPEAEAMSLDQLVETMKTEKLFVIGTSTKIVTLKDQSEIKVYDLSDPELKKETVTFGRTEVESIVSMAEIFLIPFMAIFGIGFLLLYRIVQMLLYSLLAGVIANIMKFKLPSNAIQRITTCALFPSAILYFAFLFAGSDIPVLLSIICTIVFITFGLKSAKLVAPTVTK